MGPLKDSARSTRIKSTANILRSCFKTVSLSSRQKRLGKKEFSTLRRLTLSIFSVTVAAMRSKPASLCGGQTKARRTARCRSLVKAGSSLCLALRRRLLWSEKIRDLILNLKFTEIQAAAAEREAAKL